MTLNIRRLSYALGAEVTGIDLRSPMDERTLADVNAAFLEHHVLVFRGHALTQEQHIAFGRQFGELEKTGSHRPNKDHAHPEIALIVSKPAADGKLPDENLIRLNYAITSFPGGDWHSDKSYMSVPTKATLLRAVDIPDIGGDTMFANGHLAYDALSSGMKKFIEPLYGAHIQEGRALDHSSPEKLAETLRSTRTAQPIVRVHPETRRKALYLGYRVRQLVDLTAEESAPILEILRECATRPQFVYRHVWQPHDLVMWDNRCTMHVALGDFDRRTKLRHLEKTSVVGTPSGYAYPL